jgi:predicted MFS family arabinose efflux permease
LAALNFFAPTPFYPQMAHDLQTTVPLLGQVVTLMALISAGLGLLAGPLADRYGYRWPLVVGLLAIAVGLLGTGLAPTYPVLLGLGVVMGCGDALAYSLPFAIAATYFSGSAQRRAIGWTIGALSTAPIIGVPLLTAVGGLTNWRVALAAAGVAALGVAWFVAAVLPADRLHPSSRLRVGALLAAYTPLLKHPPSLRFLGVSALRGMWWVGLLTYMGAFLGTVVGFSPQHVGLVYALAGGAYTAGSITAGSLLGGLSPRPVVAISSVIGGVLVAPMFLFPIPWVVLPLLLVASGAASICSVSVVALLADESPAGAGTTMVLNGSVLNLGTAGGAVLGGALIAFGGYAALGIGLPLFALVAAALAWWPGSRQAGTRSS